MASYVVGIEDQDTMYVCFNSDWEARAICSSEDEVFQAIDWSLDLPVMCSSSVYEADEYTDKPWILKLCKRLGEAK